MRYISSGGLGDYFIVSLKMQDIAKGDDDIDWLHVESNDIVKPIAEINKLFEVPTTLIVWDKDYIRHMKFTRSPGRVFYDSLSDFPTAPRSKSRIPIPTPVIGKCGFYGLEHKLQNPFLGKKIEPKKACDIVIQCSGGVNNERNWKDLRGMINLLGVLGREITLIGTDEYFKDQSFKKAENLVGKTTLTEAMGIVQNCNLYIGMSGLLSYFACASKVKNVHTIESKSHEISYFHKDWSDYTIPVKGYPAEILNCVRKLT